MAGAVTGKVRSVVSSRPGTGPVSRRVSEVFQRSRELKYSSKGFAGVKNTNYTEHSPLLNDKLMPYSKGIREVKTWLHQSLLP